MPAILTHYAFAKNLYKEESSYSSLMYLGAQGPDIFFFIGYLKKRNNAKKIRAFGHYLHSIDMALCYNFMLEYIKKQKEEDKEPLYAYIKGLLYHYALDRNAHAYIFSRTGWKEDGVDDGGYYMRAHVFFESNIDVLLANHYKTTKNGYKTIKCPLDQVLLVSKMFSALNEAIFHFDYIDEDTFKLSYLDMCQIQKMFYSPTGFKRLLYYPFRKKIQLWVQTNPRKTFHDDEIQYLNLNRNIWKDIKTGNDHTETFFDLIESAREDALKIDELIELSKTKNIENEMLDFTHNITHDGLLEGEKMKYFDFAFNIVKKIPF